MHVKLAKIPIIVMGTLLTEQAATLVGISIQEHRKRRRKRILPFQAGNHSAKSLGIEVNHGHSKQNYEELI